MRHKTITQAVCIFIFSIQPSLNAAGHCTIIWDPSQPLQEWLSTEQKAFFNGLGVLGRITGWTCQEDGNVPHYEAEDVIIDKSDYHMGGGTALFIENKTLSGKEVLSFESTIQQFLPYATLVAYMNLNAGQQGKTGMTYQISKATTITYNKTSSFSVGLETKIPIKEIIEVNAHIKLQKDISNGWEGSNSETLTLSQETTSSSPQHAAIDRDIYNSLINFEMITADRYRVQQLWPDGNCYVYYVRENTTTTKGNFYAFRPGHITFSGIRDGYQYENVSVPPDWKISQSLNHYFK